MRGGLQLLFGLGLWAATGCKVELGADPNAPDGGGSAGGDAAAGADAPTDAIPLGPWGAPARVPGAGTLTGEEDDGTLSSSTLELVYSYALDPGDPKDLWYMSRTSTTDPWTAPVRLAFNATASDETPRFSADDLTLYFASARGGASLDIYSVRRTAVGQPWAAPQLVPGVSTAGVDKTFSPCAVGTTYMAILGQDIGEGTLGSPPTVVAQLSSPQVETGVYQSPDCLTTYFASTRSGTNKVYVATRTAVGAPWTTPVMVTDFVALGGAQEDPWLAADFRTFAIVSDIGGSKDLYLSTR